MVSSLANIEKKFEKNKDILRQKNDLIVTYPDWIF